MTALELQPWRGRVQSLPLWRSLCECRLMLFHVSVHQILGSYKRRVEVTSGGKGRDVTWERDLTSIV